MPARRRLHLRDALFCQRPASVAAPIRPHIRRDAVAQKVEFHLNLPVL